MKSLKKSTLRVKYWRVVEQERCFNLPLALAIFFTFRDFRNTCRLIIRKIQFAPASNKAGPKAEISKQFMMTDKPVNVEISLEKEV